MVGRVSLGYQPSCVEKGVRKTGHVFGRPRGICPKRARIHLCGVYSRYVFEKGAPSSFYTSATIHQPLWPASNPVEFEASWFGKVKTDVKMAILLCFREVAMVSQETREEVVCN